MVETRFGGACRATKEGAEILDLKGAVIKVDQLSIR